MDLRRTAVPLWLLLLLCLGLLSITGLWWRSQTEANRLRALYTQLQQANQGKQAAPVPPQATTPAPSVPVEKVQPESQPRHGSPALESTRLEEVRQLVRVREQLTSMEESLAQAQDRIRELEAEGVRLQQEGQRVTEAQGEMRTQLATANRLAESLQEELKSRTTRASDMESSLRKLQEEQRGTTDRAVRISNQLRELDQLNSRREAYLNNILRRFRELTDQYRTLAIRQDTTTRDLSANPNSPDLSRIQNAIAMADEDLRQLSQLDAQARSMTQRLRNVKP